MPQPPPDPETIYPALRKYREQKEREQRAREQSKEGAPQDAELDPQVQAAQEVLAGLTEEQRQALHALLQRAEPTAKEEKPTEKRKKQQPQ